MPRFLVGTGTRTFTRTLTATGEQGSSASIAGLRFRWLPDPFYLPPSFPPPPTPIIAQVSFNEGGSWASLGEISEASGSIVDEYVVRHIVEISYSIATGATVKCYDEWSDRETTKTAGAISTTANITSVTGWEYLNNSFGISLTATADGLYGTDCATVASATFSGFPVCSLSVGPETTSVGNGHGATIDRESSASTGATGASLSASVAITGVATSVGSGWSVGAYSATCSATNMRPDIPISAGVEVRQLEQAFSGSLDARIQFLNSTTGAVVESSSWQALTAGAGTVAYDNHSAQVAAHNAVTASSIKPYQPIRTQYREGSTEYAAYTMGAEDDGFELTYGGSETVDTGSSLTPSGDWPATWNGLIQYGATATPYASYTSGSIAASGGVISIDTPIDPGAPLSGIGHHYTWVQRVSTLDPLDHSGFLGWTKLRFRIKSDAASHPLRIQLEPDNPLYYPATQPPKRWSFETGAANSWETIEIDLSAEHSGAPFSVIDNEWVEDGTYGNAYYGGGYSLYWADLLFDTHYEIDDIELIEPDSMALHLIMDNSVEGDATPATPGPRAGVVEGDGQHVLDMYARWSNSFTVSSVVDAINDIRKPWSATGDASSPTPVWTGSPALPVYDGADMRHNEIMPSYSIGGGGEGWHLGDDAIGVTSGVAVTVPVQWRVDCIWWDWHDSPTGVFGSPGEIDARAVHIARNAPWGKVIDEDFDRASGVLVNLYNTSTGTDLTETQDTSDTEGAYFDYAPNSSSPASLGVRAGGVVVPSGWLMGSTFLGRHRLVMIALVVEPKSWVSADTHATGLTMFASTVDGELVTGISANWITNTWEEKKAHLPMSQPCLRFLRGSAEGRVAVLYLDGSAAKWIYSDDLGGSWSVAATIWASGASRVALASHPAGWQMAAARVSGAIEVKWLDNQGNVIEGPHTALASGAADDAIAVTWDVPASMWYLIYLDTGGATQRIESADGINWS